MKNKVITISLTMLLLASTASIAFGAGLQTRIEAVKDEGISLLLEGHKVELNGQYPLTYNDTTYLPVRKIAEIVGLPVNWDEESKQVLLGGSFTKPRFITDLPLKNFSDVSNVHKITDNASLYLDLGHSKTNYKNGLEMRVPKGEQASSYYGDAYVKIHGMTSLKGVLYSKDYSCKLVVLTTSDGTRGNIKEHNTIDVNANTLTRIDVDIQDVTGYIGFKVIPVGESIDSTILRLFDVTIE